MSDDPLHYRNCDFLVMAYLLSDHIPTLRWDDKVDSYDHNYCDFFAETLRWDVA